jgi:hypothetical protein
MIMIIIRSFAVYVISPMKRISLSIEFETVFGGGTPLLMNLNLLQANDTIDCNDALVFRCGHVSSLPWVAPFLTTHCQPPHSTLAEDEQRTSNAQQFALLWQKSMRLVSYYSLRRSRSRSYLHS